ncbi:MAG: hypothetical protein RIT43_2080, partial [Bacteroidota bacterium]
LVNKSGRTLKGLFHTPSGYFFLSSQGLFFASSITDQLSDDRMIDRVWYREMCASPFSKTYFAASNEGLVELEAANGVCRVVQRFSKTKQILSLSPDFKSQLIYFLSFDGRVYSVNKVGKIQLVLKIEKEFRATQLRCHGNKIYIATNKGILTFEPSTRRQLLFDRFSGLISNNITSIAFKDGYCWTVGEGIHKIPLSEFNSSSGFSRIRLLRIQVNKVDVAISNLIEINHDDEVAIFMDGKCYRSNDDFEFAYQLNGSGNTWRKFPGSLQSIDFSSLPSGIVRIDIKIIDHQGNDSLNQVNLKFYVHPPFWQRWWFYVLVAFTTLLMAVVIFRLRLKVIQKKQMLELKRLKLENELRLTQQSALKAQMNPHFLFNVLNSIKGYIYENDKGNAAKYLSEFSNLVRKVLELSSVPTVPLDEELEALNLYINLEAMLLQNDFEYKLNIEDGIDLSGIHLPALLLQPYVENAFKHGLRHKVGQKILEISVRMDHEEQLLIIEVRDNGIGRKAADELNMQNRSEHQSFGNSAIEKRIKLLNFKRKDIVGVEIRDNFKENQSSGTTVIIQIHV